ncbi:hypothetical protein [Parapedobacter sp.]
MKKIVLTVAVWVATLTIFVACNNNQNSSSEEIEHTDVVPSGTYTGVAEKVDPDEKEIYVKTGDGKTLELYFTDNTQLLQNEQPVEFSALAEGQNLEVTVEKKGERLEPVTVKIME